MTGTREVVIARTGAANLASVRAAFERLGARVRFSESPGLLEDAPAVVLPGVGAFGPAMRRLRETGAAAALSARVERGASLLCVCLGLQLLFQQSDEAPEASGLGLLPGRVGRFEKARVVPHMGWNRVCADPDARFLRSGYAYFAHSYRLLHSPPGSRVATCTQSERFVAGFEHAGVLACQFHPELSGSYGRQLLGAWLAAAFAEEQSAC